jgi:hypothetical protein
MPKTHASWTLTHGTDCCWSSITRRSLDRQCCSRRLRERRTHRSALSERTSCGSPTSTSIGCPFAKRPALSRTVTALPLLVQFGQHENHRRPTELPPSADAWPLLLSRGEARAARFRLRVKAALRHESAAIRECDSAGRRSARSRNGTISIVSQGLTFSAASSPRGCAGLTAPLLPGSPEGEAVNDAFEADDAPGGS